MHYAEECADVQAESQLEGTLEGIQCSDINNNYSKARCFRESGRILQGK